MLKALIKKLLSLRTEAPALENSECQAWYKLTDREPPQGAMCEHVAFSSPPYSGRWFSGREGSGFKNENRYTYLGIPSQTFWRLLPETDHQTKEE